MNAVVKVPESLSARQMYANQLRHVAELKARKAKLEASLAERMAPINAILADAQQKAETFAQAATSLRQAETQRLLGRPIDAKELRALEEAVESAERAVASFERRAQAARDASAELNRSFAAEVGSIESTLFGEENRTKVLREDALTELGNARAQDVVAAANALRDALHRCLGPFYAADPTRLDGMNGRVEIPLPRGIPGVPGIGRVGTPAPYFDIEARAIDLEAKKAIADLDATGTVV